MATGDVEGNFYAEVAFFCGAYEGDGDMLESGDAARRNDAAFIEDERNFIDFSRSGDRPLLRLLLRLRPRTVDPLEFALTDVLRPWIFFLSI